MRLIAIFIFLLGCGASKTPPPETQNETEKPENTSTVEAKNKKAGTVKTVSFASDALGVTKQYWIYLPSGYEASSERSAKRYPVIYMLHGLGGSENNWVKHMGLADAADEMNLEAIVVMPDGDNSFYVNSATPADYDKCLTSKASFGRSKDRKQDCVKSAKHEDYIAIDLVAHVDTTYRTIADRSARAIGGLSMGGYGALMLGMRHTDIFSSVASHSGVNVLLYAGPFPFESGKGSLFDSPADLIPRLGPMGPLFSSIWGDDIKNWRDHDPAVLAQSLPAGKLDIYIDCGTEDDFRLQHGASYLHEVLQARGIEHTFELLPGRHNAAFWTAQIDDSLRFHVSHFAKMQLN